MITIGRCSVLQQEVMGWSHATNKKNYLMNESIQKKHENLKSLGIFRSSNGIIKNQINDH